MRETKFRAKPLIPDHDGGGLVPSSEWVYGTSCIELRNGKKAMLTHDSYGDLAVQLIVNDSSFQGIGLKDKNGVDIYEGDVITFTNPGDDENEYAYWRYSLDGKPISVERDSRGFYPFTCASGQIDMEHPYPTESKFIEVIGNIYENPELLSGASMNEGY